MPLHQKVRANRWCKFERTFSDHTAQTRYIREIIFGQRSTRTYWEITTDPETMPENSTSFVMTNLPGKVHQIKKILGNLYGLRTWIEYSFRQCKQELGWTDYRFTKFEQIEKWWEVILSAYLMISLNSKVFGSLNQAQIAPNSDEVHTNFPCHQHWHHQGGWKSAPPAPRFPRRKDGASNTLNNLRLLIQPVMSLWLIFPWLDVFPNRYLLLGFHQLIDAMNHFRSYFPDG